MPSIFNDIKAVLTGLKVTLNSFVQEPVTEQYPWTYPELPPNSRGVLRMADFHDENSIGNKSAWYPGTRWAPCTTNCPAHTDARAYMTLAAEGKFRDGLELLRRTYPFVGTLGRICPAPCEKGCSRAYLSKSPCAIRNTKRFFADWELQQPQQDRFDYQAYVCQAPLNGKSVGIVGAGPAGYQCAMVLRLLGFEVFMYEAKDIPGGFLTNAIPAYRLPREVVNSEMERIHSLPGIHLKLNCEIGKDLSWEELEKRHQDIVIAAGAWKPYRLSLEHEEKPWVWFGEDFLEQHLRGQLGLTPKKAVIVGGGNTGFDCARTCVRLGADVTMIYRRTRKEMPSEDEEIEEGQEEGVKLEWLTSPQKIVMENGRLKGLEVLRNRLGAKDSSGRRKPVPIEGSEELLECDLIITALGRCVELPWLPADIKTNRNGTIAIDASGQTSHPHVWACGDVIKVSTVVAAIGGADRVALSIAAQYGISADACQFLFPYEKDRTIPIRAEGKITTDTPAAKRRQGLGLVATPPDHEASFVPPPMGERLRCRPFRDNAQQNKMTLKPTAERIKNFDEVSLGLSEKQVTDEGLRCFGCAAEMCVGCGVCVHVCPDACIYLDSQKASNGRQYPASYSIDLTKCCFCGLCTEACPTKSLTMSGNFELSMYSKRDAYMDKQRLNLGLVRREKQNTDS
ncbi:FAD-dependent oxidoreductase [bacterium]|nr:FAD-dependent oxidoreductase [bacterium]